MPKSGLHDTRLQSVGQGSSLQPDDLPPVLTHLIVVSRHLPTQQCQRYHAPRQQIVVEGTEIEAITELQQATDSSCSS